MSIPNASKYVIIGAGIHGLSTAYHLALELKKRNLGSGEDILVIDKSGIDSRPLRRLYRFSSGQSHSNLGREEETIIRS